MNRKALHAEDGLLLSHGFCDFAASDGQFVRDVADDFDEEPRRRRWNGAAYEDIVPSVNEAIDAQIRALEVASGGYMRGLREFMLATAEVLKTQGGPDFMANKGMQNVKALDDEIRTLRAQRQP